MTVATRFVIEPSAEPGAAPHVRMERVARWEFVGEVEPASDVKALGWEIGLAMRDAGILGEPVVSYDADGALHLDWPTPAEHGEDPAHARLLTLARLPLDRECPELDSTPVPDPEAEAEIERLVHEDRIARLAEEIAPTLPARRRVGRKRRKRAVPQPPEVTPSEPERQPTKGPPKPPPPIFAGSLTSAGWLWRPVGSGLRLRARMRWRR